MATFSIGEIAKQSGFPASTIRYYERIGILPTANRVSGKRIYHANILEKLRVIKLAKQVGFNIEETDTLINDFPENASASARWQALAPTKLDEITQQIRELQTMRDLLVQTLDCQCEALEDCANGSSTK